MLTLFQQSLLAASLPKAALKTPAQFAVFDGTDDSVSIADTASLKITGDQTVEFWVRKKGTARVVVTGKAYAGEFMVVSETDGTMSYYCGRLGSNSGARDTDYIEARTTSGFSANVWKHCAVVRDMTAMEIRWYFDGNLVFTRTIPAGFTIASGTNNMTMGKNYITTFLAADLSDVRLWNVARTQQEIKDNLQVSLTTAVPGLVVNCLLNTDASDSSGNLNNGTIAGGMVFGTA